jgi:SsrA-binding protein
MTKPTKSSPPKTAGPKSQAIKLITENRKARHDYMIEDTFEAGMELTGSEVKSLRKGDANLKDSYVVMANGQAYLLNAHISVYKASSYMNHEPERRRRLLLQANELLRLEKAIDGKGYTCVPLKIYFKGSWAKIEIALAKGKQSGDKRQAIKDRDNDRELAQLKRKHR